MPNSISSDHHPDIYTANQSIDETPVNVSSHPSPESVTRQAKDVRNSQHTMTRQVSKRPHSPTHENSKIAISTLELGNNLLLLADAAVIVESYNTTFTPTSGITFISTQEETSGIPINIIDSFVYEVTHLAYILNDGNVTYSQELIKYEWELFETIYREFKENKKNGYPLNNMKVWDKIKIDLIEEYKKRSEKLLMWNAAPYQQGTDDAQNITLKTVGRVKQELKHYLRQDLMFFLKIVADKY
ncbi:hypothetical protein [Erwinia piriflorinigrans]|uniref:Uncharacterized protein n=1 Tax=Erwinia piriflorinigrans CFBP 5888 TaxID=1161919 RepID=V5Z5C5_9GAMM|nr:hypothetical protein [Erwinia piriflorinigrans]CCG86132.1 hypothetical protein EPIR_0767 [Erwinia piriflorinigrans CFBP 5888]